MQTHETLPGPPWTILNTLKWTTDYFNRHAIEDPRASAEILLAHVLWIQRIDLYLRYDQPLDADELAGLRKLIKRRTRREPVAYIVGHKEFWSLDLKVTPHVLIPRPETECLVETAIDHLKTASQAAVPRVLELGVGSGAISIAMAREHPKARYLASDLSVPAVRLARENARRLLKNGAIHFFAGRWFDALDSSGTPYDLILSNPPYVRDAQIEKLAPEIRDYEPRSALAGGPDGLRAIRHLLKAAPGHLKSGGVLMIEMGHDQKTAVVDLAAACRCYGAVMFKKDYGGCDRVAVLQKGHC